jgi:hypothetical protein
MTVFGSPSGWAHLTFSGWWIFVIVILLVIQIEIEIRHFGSSWVKRVESGRSIMIMIMIMRASGNRELRPLPVPWVTSPASAICAYEHCMQKMR